MAFQLLAGMFLGAALVSVVWGLILKTGKSRSEAIRRERDEVMHSIGEIWVEIDSLLSSYKCGVVDDKGFHETFSAKIETINHLLKPNMHLFEVYYVKYIEGQIEQYKKTAHYTGIAQPITAGTAADHELETSYAMVGHHEAQEKSGFTAPPETKVVEDADVAGAGASGEKEAEPAKIETAADESAEEEFAPEEEAEVIEQSIEQSIEEQPVDATAIKAEEKDEVVSSEARSEVADEEAMVAETNLKEEQPVAEETEEKSADETSGEQGTDEVEMFDVVIAEEKKQQEEAEVTDESAGEVAAEKALESEEKTDVASPETKGDVESEFFGEEDFTMETLMDVDINAINPYIEEAAELKKNESAAEKQNDDLDVVIADNAVHTETISEEPEKTGEKKEHPALADLDDDIPEETTYTPASELEKKTPVAEESSDEPFVDVEDFEVTIAEEAAEKPEDVEPVAAEEAEQEEMTFFDSELVTGDDIADTIAALETKPGAPSLEEKSEDKPEKKNSKKSKSKKSEKEPVTVASEKKKSDEKKKDGEESITGDDVVDQIDSFFGLIE